ncbi:NAD-dependent epimerase/dehydratase family protein [Tropicimonas isoalkanivorans]|uniref:UDP-glucose 4-epimerase n=1 Tax=Tropicimonas isoalkanivorans TaxID=441112 RepID=A0A1I1L2Y8_9RHOB|nr:NAD-dependent epimerase/dehydratase family protein [Tropicimonas isoalkanivorans]SFC65338.1 UDP-glucose 4-epimerase [Tropicimonas isoalkanivorans]
MTRTKSDTRADPQRFLVTGGCGFVGAALCHHLEASGVEIVVLDNLSSGDPARLPPTAELITGDICDRRAIDKALQGVTGVFHLAAISSVELCTTHRAEASRTNLQGTVTLLEATGDLPVVFTSSAAVYGEQVDLPVREDAVPAPISSYAIDKLGSERHMKEAADLWGARCIAVRPFNIFGPGQSPNSPYSGVLTRFVEGARNGAPLTVNGDGGQTRDFIHVGEVAEALFAAMKAAVNSKPGMYSVLNICSGEAISILDLARLVNREAGSQVPIAFGPTRLGDIRHSAGDPRRAEKEIGFRATMPLQTGIAEMLAERPAPGPVRRSATF